MNIEHTAKTEEEAKEIARKLQHECIDKGASVGNLRTCAVGTMVYFEIINSRDVAQCVEVEIKPEPEFKEGILGIFTSECGHYEHLGYHGGSSHKGTIIRHTFKKDGKLRGHEDDREPGSFMPLPNYERALELMISDVRKKVNFNWTHSGGIKDHYMHLANKELLK